ncbi:MAG: hypothetical protein KatS3mg003_2297 [Candidatus Nitrosocaldaceae archaeon]|nr:MAG: hypothetical protein KatS3mg003_2297 [Candidatus Nitrosocaldaceae archaeon]
MEEFPVKSYEGFEQKVLDGYTIYKSGKRWIALVVVETSNKKELRLYSWELRKGEWKVALASQNVGFWDWDKLYEKVKEFKEKYNI